MKNKAHLKYYFRFKELGDNSSKEELYSVLEAIHEAIRKRELTSANCEVWVVQRMQKVLVEAIERYGYTPFYLCKAWYFFIPHEDFAKVKPNHELKIIELDPTLTDVSEKAKAKSKAKTKTKAKAKAKAKPKTKAKVKARARNK